MRTIRIYGDPYTLKFSTFNGLAHQPSFSQTILTVVKFFHLLGRDFTVFKFLIFINFFSINKRQSTILNENIILF